MLKIQFALSMYFQNKRKYKHFTSKYMRLNPMFCARVGDERVMGEIQNVS